MTLHFLTPYSVEKNLAKAYNEAMQLIPDNDWVCFNDIDCMYLQPDQPKHIYEYIQQNPDAGILTCYTNRVSELSPQLLGGKISDNDNLSYWKEQAKKYQQRLYMVTETKPYQDISGFCMVFNKETWNQAPFKEYPFPNKGGCIGVDTIFNRSVKALGKKVLIMEGIVMFHDYRMGKSVTDKSHLLA